MLRTISDQRDPAVDDGYIRYERSATGPIVDPGGRKNRVDQGV